MVNYEAITIVGVKLFSDKVWKKQIVKIGEHDFPQDVMFHPQTGKKLWEEFYTSDFDKVNGCLPADKVNINKSDKYNIYAVEESSFSSRRPNALVGVRLSDMSQYVNHVAEEAPTPDINKLREEIKNILEKYGLWEDQEVKIFCVLHAH